MNKKKQKAPVAVLVIALLFGFIWGISSSFYMDKLAEQISFFENFFLEYLVFLLTLFLAFFLQTVIHEAGHLIFGLMTGYKLVSFRIGSFIWLKSDGKIKLKRYSLAGTGGQCLMVPPEMKNGKIPYVLYNLGGCLNNLIFSLVFIILSCIFRDNAFASFIFINLAIPGVLLLFLNGIPMTTASVDNDGKNALSLGKNSKALRALWLQLKINEKNSAGIRVKDMPSEWFELPEPEDRNNSLIASLGYFAGQRFLDEQKFTEAYNLSRLYISTDNALPGIYNSLLTCDLIFLELILCKGEVNIHSLYDAQLKKFVKSMKKHPSVLRMQYAYALLSENDPTKANIIKSDFEKIAKKYPYPTDIESERELMDIATEKAKKMNT